MTETQTKPLEVELWVCETCWENGIEDCVGKIPQGRGSQNHRGMCRGPAGADHKQVGMKLHKFRMVKE